MASACDDLWVCANFASNVNKLRDMAINIIGISGFYHDSATALVCDGEIVAAAQEERFTRRKFDARFPLNAMNYCLQEGGIEVADLDYVVFYEKPLVKFERLLETYVAFAPKGFEAFNKVMPVWASNKLHLERQIRDRLGSSFCGRLCFADHHESHAASAFFPSPFEEAAILTLDAVGEWATSSVGVGRRNRIELMREMRFPHSLGMLYSALTYYTGFQVNSGEYKLMGLAPYGQPKFVDVILGKLVDLGEDGSLWLDMSYFNYCQGLTMTSPKFHELFGGPPRSPESFITQKDMDLAASIQKICEEVVLRAGRHAHRLSGLPNLVMAGGVALNCVANGRLLREGPFENIWVQPAAGDAGGALGASLLVWHHVLDKPRQINARDNQRGSFLGPAFTDDDIGLFLDSVGATYEYITDEDLLLDRVARLLADEKTIGWFYGRMEFGPRALGSRSILGDARSPHTQQTMNLKIKFRESFRPFAPCVLREFAHDLFDIRPNEESPYMLFVAPVRDQYRLPLGPEDAEKMRCDPDLRIRVAIPRSNIPAITHVDYSARIQTVDPERHCRFYRLLRHFYELSGCPVIVNTSFNIRGEPIVCTFEDAYRCFMATHIDCLVLESYILMKTSQPEESLQDPEAYKANYSLD
jgi:carbamoyltransferase